jgi:hypothetical protein
VERMPCARVRVSPFEFDGATSRANRWRASAALSMSGCDPPCGGPVRASGQRVRRTRGRAYRAALSHGPLSSKDSSSVLVALGATSWSRGRFHHRAAQE